MFLIDSNPNPTRKCLEVDPIPGFKYSHLNISGPMHYRKIVALEFLLVLLCFRTKTGWWRHRSQNLMIILKILRICNVNSKINLKITVEFKMLSHFVKFWLT
jgi:hypothetical protein